MMKELAISVEHISKVYKLYRGKSGRLKDALHLSRKKCYEEYYALSDVNFTVHKGETVGLIGTNGAGKSTLLKLVTGVLTPSAGQIEVNGKVSALLELGAGFNYEYTGIENIFFNGMLLGYTREQMEEKLPRIVEFAGIGDYIHQPVKSYSSGMFARLAFAMAIHVEPDILIVDEALSVGDIYFQSRCFKKMDEIRRDGTTILLVTHDMSSIIKYCDRVVLLNHGKVVKIGNPKEMVDIYKKILVGQYDENEEDTDGKRELSAEQGSWMSSMRMNDKKVCYGSGKAKIIDFGVFDEEGRIAGMVLKKSMFSFKIKVEFFEDIEYPIFTYTVKNAKGAEVSGTNTMFEKIDFPIAKKGEKYVVTFTQKALLQGGEYLLSFSCTGYQDGKFTVYDRLYDVTSLTVVSEQDTVGVFDMDTSVAIERA